MHLPLSRHKRIGLTLVSRFLAVSSASTSIFGIAYGIGFCTPTLSVDVHEAADRGEQILQRQRRRAASTEPQARGGLSDESALFQTAVMVTDRAEQILQQRCAASPQSPARGGLSDEEVLFQTAVMAGSHTRRGPPLTVPDARASDRGSAVASGGALRSPGAVAPEPVNDEVRAGANRSPGVVVPNLFHNEVQPGGPTPCGSLSEAVKPSEDRLQCLLLFASNVTSEVRAKVRARAISSLQLASSITARMDGVGLIVVLSIVIVGLLLLLVACTILCANRPGKSSGPELLQHPPREQYEPSLKPREPSPVPTPSMQVDRRSSFGSTASERSDNRDINHMTSLRPVGRYESLPAAYGVRRSLREGPPGRVVVTSARSGVSECAPSMDSMDSGMMVPVVSIVPPQTSPLPPHPPNLFADPDVRAPSTSPPGRLPERPKMPSGPSTLKRGPSGSSR